MAETAVMLLFDKLERLLHQEVAILSGVHDDVRSVSRNLKIIKAFLKEAEQETSESLINWVNQVRDLAFRMEDAVDRYMLKVAERGQRHGIYGAVTHGKEKLKSVTHRHDIAKEVREIEASFNDLKNTKETLGFKTTSNSVPDANAASSSSSCTRLRYTNLGAHFVEESQLVGIHHHREFLTDWLCKQETKRPLMLVVGAQGTGKTAIVKNVYKNLQGERNSSFNNYAWINMSCIENKEMLLESIIQKIHMEHPVDKRDSVSVIEKIRDHLKDKKYLIVFDDVREFTFWDDVIKLAMQVQGNRKGSNRVIMITRDKRFVNHCHRDTQVEVLKVKPLSQNDALELFCRNAFKYEQQEYPELKELCVDFVKKCNGVPLAIVSIAGLLSTKNKTKIEWKRVYNQLGSLLRTNDSPLKQVMVESYFDLPYHLRQCLLYFSLFPEDYSISCARLIRLWVAEGFVKEEESEDTSIEEHAEQYLAELFQRGLVHVLQLNFDGKPKTCHVHHLLLEFLVTKSKEQRFCQVMNDKIVAKSDSCPRRLSIHIKNNAAMKVAKKLKEVRCCLVFDESKKWLVRESFFSKFELLIELDLSDTCLDNLPEEIGKLLNLKYLSLRKTNIKSLPKSIGKLENLETLDLKETQVHKLPKQIKNLIKLRYLRAYYINNSQGSGLDTLQGVELETGLENLKSLQKLSFLDATNASKIIKELKQLKQLRKLGIIKLKGEYGEELCSVIEGMTHLCSLSIGAVGNHGILKLQTLGNPSLSLQRLYLNGRLEKFPNWVPKLENLVRMHLKWSGLEEDPFPYLKDLSKLIHLELYDAYQGEEVHFKKGWLKGLKVLWLGSMPKLKTIKIDKGALSSLGELKIGECHEMVQVPSDLKNLRNVKTLYLYNMPKQFIERIQDIDTIPIVVYSYDDHFVGTLQS